MTENEAIKYFKETLTFLNNNNSFYPPKEYFDLAIKSLEEIQQYHSIGTVDECREVMERQRAKKIITVRARNEKENVSEGDFVHYKCPNCGKRIGSAFHYPPNEYMMESKFCDNCGQFIDWSDNH